MQTLAGEMWLMRPSRPPKVNPKQIKSYETICDHCVWMGQCKEEVAKGNFCACEDVLPERELLDFLSLPSPIEIKLCECGCGEPAPLAKNNNAARGLKKGQPTRFVNGHNNRKRTSCG